MKRNKHSLSHYRLQSMDMGALVPVGWFEVLPGDTIQHSTSALIRAAPLVSPVMHPLSIRIHHWYVPYRLIWDEFENFITGGPQGTSTPAWPSFTASGLSVGSLLDYLGVPTGTTNAMSFSALPSRAYDLIWNENYRDQDLETAVAISTASGADATTSNVLKNCSWEKDYFTSSRPWEQKGPAITVPIGTTAPVTITTNSQNVTTRRSGDPGTERAWSVATTSNMVQGGAAPGATESVRFGSVTGLQGSADLTGASAVTVNALRQALALQRFEEARARYGSRYTEYLRYLGIRSSDARLQRPEYLGGGKNTVQFSEVLQTGPSASPDQANVVGALKGHGISAMRSNRYRRFIEEHGLIMSLMSIRPKTMYLNGLAKKFKVRTKEEVWQKELEHIGQQGVHNQEIYADTATPLTVFGYQDRYDEYRRQESGIAGEFRTTLNYWHLARDFGSAPALNASFVSCVPTLRTFASATTDPFYVMANHSIQARRLVARTGKSYIF